MAEVTDLISRVGFHGSTNQLGLTHTPDCPEDQKFYQSVGSLYDYDTDTFKLHEKDFSVFNSSLKGTYLEWIYKNVPFQVARMRLMRMPSKKCLSMHDDTGPRYHIALKTNPHAFLFFASGQSFHIPADGFLYGMRATEIHTAFNADPKEDRIHLVFSDLIHS